MTKEALKLALEALEDLGMKHYESTGEVLYKETFTAIKEALANEALEKMAENARELGLDYEPTQEPVACVEYIPCCTDKTCSKCKAATPPQRTWVGLTDEEISAIDWKSDETLHDFARAIEAKLKEKNT